MENLFIESTKYTPEINFDAQKNLLSIKGRSYPENTSSFYSPIFSWLERYLDQIQSQKVTVNIELIYFNSSSSKILLDFFDILEDKANEGADIKVNWIYDEEIEEALEFGEEFQEDLEAVQFNLVPKT